MTVILATKRLTFVSTHEIPLGLSQRIVTGDHEMDLKQTHDDKVWEERTY